MRFHVFLAVTALTVGASLAASSKMELSRRMKAPASAMSPAVAAAQGVASAGPFAAGVIQAKLHRIPGTRDVQVSPISGDGHLFISVSKWSLQVVYDYMTRLYEKLRLMVLTAGGQERHPRVPQAALSQYVPVPKIDDDDLHNMYAMLYVIYNMVQQNSGAPVVAGVGGYPGQQLQSNVPYQQYPLPYQQIPASYQQNPVPYPQNAVPYPQNAVPYPQNAVPYQQNQVPYQQNRNPVLPEKNPVQSAKNPVPLRKDLVRPQQNPVTIAKSAIPFEQDAMTMLAGTQSSFDRRPSGNGIGNNDDVNPYSSSSVSASASASTSSNTDSKRSALRKRSYGSTLKDGEGHILRRVARKTVKGVLAKLGPKAVVAAKKGK